MNVSYQRELYRSQMRCELEGEEASYGYPLQMCLRNSIPGLLPCNAEPIDGKLYVCWDITSRNSLQELGGGGFTLELLERVLQAVYGVMRELDGYLVSSGYLVLLPEQIYLDASRKTVEFICDFGEEGGFRSGIQRLAEYILAGIDHKDPEQMRLGYGLYRLAVQENFSREEFQRLLFGREKQAEERCGQQADGKDTQRTGAGSGPDAACAGEPGREDSKFPKMQLKDAVADQAERQKILDSFFRDDEEEKQGFRETLPLYALLVAVAVCGLEIFFYFRNGRHIHPGWLVFSLFLTAVCTGLVCMGQYIRNGREEKQDDEAEFQAPFYFKKSAVQDMSGVSKPVVCESAVQNMSGFGKPIVQEASGFKEAAEQREALYPNHAFYGEVGETMVLQDPRLCREEELCAILEPAGHSGGRIIIPAKGAVFGKLPEAADIILPSPAASRIHARIIRQGEEYFVQDLNSRNGTRVNGCPLASQQLIQLKEQDEVGFADLSYRFCLESGHRSK